MDNFVIIAPHSKIRTYKVFTLIIVLFNLVIFTIAISNTNGRSLPYYAALISCLSLAAPLLQYFIFGNKEAGLKNMLVGIFIAGIGWLFMDIIWNGLAMMLIAVFGLISIKPLRFIFDANGITMPGFPRKNVLWSGMENVIIRDDMLTLDFKNNKLIQFSIKDADNQNLDAAAFNQFVQQQMFNNKILFKKS